MFSSVVAEAREKMHSLFTPNRAVEFTQRGAVRNVHARTLRKQKQQTRETQKNSQNTHRVPVHLKPAEAETCSAPKTKHPGTNRAEQWMRLAQRSEGSTDGSVTKAWVNTGEPALQAWIQVSSYT